MVADNWWIWKRDPYYGHVSWQGTTSLLPLISLHVSYLICFLFDFFFPKDLLLMAECWVTVCQT